MHLICFTAIFFPGFALKKKIKINGDQFKAFLSNQANSTVHVHTGCFWGEKSFTVVLSPASNRRLQKLLYQLHNENLPGALLRAYVGHRHCKSLLVFPHQGELQLCYSDVPAIFLLSFTANSHLIGFSCSDSHLVFCRDLLMTGCCGLDNTWIFTGIPFFWSWSIPHVLLYFTHLTKFPDFQAEGVMSRGVK